MLRYKLRHSFSKIFTLLPEKGRGCKKSTEEVSRKVYIHRISSSLHTTQRSSLSAIELDDIDALLDRVF